MKILQVNNFFHIRGGSDRAFANTVDLLRGRGHEVVAFASDEGLTAVDYRFDVDDKVVPANFNGSIWCRISSLPAYFYNSSVGCDFANTVESFQPDIVHLHTVYGRLSNSIVSVLQDYNLKSVMTLHDYRMMCPVNVFLDGESRVCTLCSDGNYLHGIRKNCKNNFINSIVNSLECYFRDNFFSYKRFIDHFIFPSRFTCDMHRQHLDLSAERCHLLPNFSEDYSLEAQQGTSSYLYFGRISHEKGIFSLIEVWPENPDFSLYIVGAGTEESMARVESEATGRSNVEYLGHKSGDELYRLIKNSRFIIVPSVCYENNPMTVIEAYSQGTPVVGADIGGIPEMVDDGDTGFLYDPFDPGALLRVLEKSKLLPDVEYQQMREQARSRYETSYTSELHYRDLLDIYQVIIG